MREAEREADSSCFVGEADQMTLPLYDLSQRHEF